MLIVFANAIMIGLESEYETPENTVVFEYFELIFFSIYTTEALVKIIALRSLYWKSGYNWFDFILLLTSVIQYVIQDLVSTMNVTFLRIIRSGLIDV